ncbi:MAG: NAD(P)-binding domain-containing protein [Paludibacter sp.]|nr:NAD(P)-binding domain-containing protein [Paludibacter sp.]
MELLFEQIIIYGVAALLIAGVLVVYILKQKRESKDVTEKIAIAKEEGAYEPVSLYPVVDPNRCIKSGACIKACPEHDILGIRDGRATIINASRCIGHGACFRACPVEAISLWIGTEKRGVDLPQISPDFETNMPGMYIAGELGGMGLIKNAVTQGREAVENIAKKLNKTVKTDYDLIVVGAGPAGISATLAAKKAGLNVLTLEQDTLGGTVFTYPRSKIIMTSPMDLPLYGKVKLKETSKTELLELWNTVLSKNDINIKENTKVETITRENNIYTVHTNQAETFTTQTVLLALGRRGTPRKLNIQGEMSEKVAYRLLDPELIKNKKILVVGGGDSAIESALLLANDNKVTLSYRSEKFNRLKSKNQALINSAMQTGLIDVRFSTNVKLINPENVIITKSDSDTEIILENDLVYIFAGGEMPTEFLRKIGIEINTKHGEVVLKHK